MCANPVLARREELAGLRSPGTPVDSGQRVAERALVERAPYQSGGSMGRVKGNGRGNQLSPMKQGGRGSGSTSTKKATGGGPQLSPMKPAPKRATATKIADIPAESTGGRYRSAFARDDKRASSGKLGKSTHKFENTAREARKQWRGGATTGVSVTTPFGPVNLSKFPTKDPAPKITTVKKDYSNASVGHKYSEITDALISPRLTGSKRKEREQEVATELLSSIETGQRPKKNPRIASGEESNAAAKLLAISHVSEPERVRGSSKDMRAKLRGIKKGTTSFNDAFVGGDKDTPPEFLMARNPATARRALGKGSYKNAFPPNSFRKKDPDYSDSSDDDG